MRRLLTFLALAAALASSSLWLHSLGGPFATTVAFSSCATTDASTTFTPVTSIAITPSVLLASIGCGERPSQVFKYATVAVDADGLAVGVLVSDCFAAATFVSLNPSDAQSLAFTFQVYAYNKDLYDADATNIESAAAMPAVVAAGALAQIPATYTTTCRATQMPNVSVLAVCDPFSPAANDSGAGTPENDGASDAPAADVVEDAQEGGPQDAGSMMDGTPMDGATTDGTVDADAPTE